MGLLFEQVFQIPLILENIIRHIVLEERFLIRQVSRIWKNAVDETLKDRFLLKLDLESDNWASKMKSDLQYFGSMDLSVLGFIWNEEMRRNFYTAFHLKQYGKQIKTLAIHSLVLVTEEDFISLEFLLTSMSNLKTLYLQLDKLDVPLLLKFNPRVKSKFVTVDCCMFNVEMENAEQVVSHVFKMFENLYANFDHPTLNDQLLTYLSKRTEPMPSFRFMKIEIEPEKRPHTISILKTLNPTVLPKLKIMIIEFAMPTEAFGISLEKCLKNFSESLEQLKLLCTSAEGLGNKILLSLPPLRNLRILVFTIPPIIDGTAAFLWDLGKQLAKDLPVLERLILKNDWCDDADYKEFHWENYKYPEAWCIWEPFVPILGKDNVDLSPLKTVDWLEFDLPPEWVKNSDNVDWAKSFLSVCNQLYPKNHEYFNKGIKEMQKFVDEHENVIEEHVINAYCKAEK